MNCGLDLQAKSSLSSPSSLPFGYGGSSQREKASWGTPINMYVHTDVPLDSQSVYK